MSRNERGGLSPSLNALVAFADEELSRIDIALLNLACASGLPGAEDIDQVSLLAKLDDWTHEARHQIQRNWYRFLADPADYENSPGYFHILVVITTLQRDLGVRYNPERVKDPKFQDPFCVDPDFRDSRDLFIHGILNGPGGTCASMPVLYTAVCRRLGFPVFLVEAKDHLYCRWDDVQGQFFPRERFNIEGSGHGFGMYPDSYYETWPRELSDFDRESGAYGKCLSPREELACFLTTRGHCPLDNGRRDEAIECFRWSVELAPHDKRYVLQLESILNANRGRYYIPPPPPPRASLRPGSVFKVAFGRFPPENLPQGVTIKYVSPSDADPLPAQPLAPQPLLLHGRCIKVAAGCPLPTCLPPGTPMQVVPADQADDLSAFEAAAPTHQPFPGFTRPSSPPFLPQHGRPGLNGPSHGPLPSLPSY